MTPTLLFLIFLLIIAIALFAIWRYWDRITRVTAEEQEYDERVAALNERQANRLSDEQLRRTVSEDDAWGIMVNRGRRDRERRRRPRETTRRLLPPRAETKSRTLPPRQERYGGDMGRRVDERRQRQRDEE